MFFMWDLTIRTHLSGLNLEQSELFARFGL